MRPLQEWDNEEVDEEDEGQVAGYVIYEEEYEEEEEVELEEDEEEEDEEEEEEDEEEEQHLGQRAEHESGSGMANGGLVTGVSPQLPVRGKVRQSKLAAVLTHARLELHLPKLFDQQ